MEELSGVKKALLDTYKYRIELHAHTKPVSACGRVLPEEQVDFYAEKGYDAIVITNHMTRVITPEGENVDFFDGNNLEEKLVYYMSGYEKAKIYAENKGIKVLLGAELRFAECINDYLLFGADRDILEKCYEYLPYTLEKFRNEVKLDKSVLIWAHPKRDRMVPIDTSLVDGIETFNLHPGQNSRIGLAARLAYESGAKIVTCGSDCHNDIEGAVGTCALRTKILPSDSFELAAILKSGDYIFEVGETSVVLP